MYINDSTNTFDIRNFVNELTHVKGEKYICPVCDNNNLSISKKTGAYQCWNGCQNKDIREAVAREANTKPIRPAGNSVFFYNDREGKRCIRVTRIDDGKGHKKFPQSAWDGKKWLDNLDGLDRLRIPCYRYQEVRAAIAQGNPIFICEGEGVADALWELGIAATTFIGGSGNYRKYGSYKQDLEGAKIVLCPDRDEPGVAYMEEISEDFPNAQWCYAPPSEFFWSRLPKNRGLDIKDWIASGATAAQILEAVGNKREFNIVATTSKVVTHPSFAQSNIKDIGKEIDDLIAKELKGSELFISFCNLAQKYKIAESAVSKIYHARAEELDREESAAKESEAKFRALCKKLEKIEAIEDIAFQDFEMERLSKEWKFRSKKALLDFHAKFLDGFNKKGEKLTYGLTEYFNKFADSSTDWLIRGWIPNKAVTVLHAAGGVGKTRLVSSICRALIAGKSWSGYDVESPCCVLFIETDQGSVVNINMFDEQGYLDEPEEVRERFLINDNWNINQYGKLKSMLKSLEDSHPNSKVLVVIDSLTTVSSKATFSENDQEFARPLVRLRAIAEEFNCSFLVLHHSNRSGECRGTTAIFNAADQIFKLERSDPKNPTSPLFLDIQKTRNRAPGRYSLRYDADTWTWEIVGRVEADGSLEDSYGTVQRAILDHVKKNPGVGFESEEFAHILNLAPATCRKELGVLVREGLISSMRRGRARKVYFVGQLTRATDPTDPTDPRKNEVEISEKKQKISDQLDQLTEPAQGIASELIQTSDQFGSIGSVQQSQQPESSLPRENLLEEAVTVDVPEAIAEPTVGDEVVSESGTVIATVSRITKTFIWLSPLVNRELCGKLKDGLWVASHKHFGEWAELKRVRLNRVATPSDPDWQAGQKLKLRVNGQMQCDVVEFIGFHFTVEGVAMAIVEWMGKQHFVPLDRLSETAG